MTSVATFRKLLPSLIAILMGTAGVLADETSGVAPLSPQEAQVQKDVEKILLARELADGETFVKYLHPVIFQRKIRIKENTLRNFQTAKESQSILEDLFGKVTAEADFPERAYFVQTKEHEFAIVPAIVTRDDHYGKRRTSTYILGIRESDQTAWKYIDGHDLHGNDVREFFSDFPDDQPVPDVHEIRPKTNNPERERERQVMFRRIREHMERTQPTSDGKDR